MKCKIRLNYKPKGLQRYTFRHDAYLCIKLKAVCVFNGDFKIDYNLKNTA